MRHIFTSDQVYSATGVVTGPIEEEARRWTSMRSGATASTAESRGTWRRSASPRSRVAGRMAARAQARPAGRAARTAARATVRAADRRRPGKARTTRPSTSAKQERSRGKSGRIVRRGAEAETLAIYAEDDTSDDSWVMGISADHSSALCALRRHGGLLFDSGSDELVCPEDGRSEADLPYEGLWNIGGATSRATRLSSAAKQHRVQPRRPGRQVHHDGVGVRGCAECA